MGRRKPGEDSKPTGRPTDYRPEYVQQVERLCKIGATDHDIAMFFGRGIQTVKNWRHAHPEFDAACRRGKEVADNTVEDSLFRMATGYSVDTEEVFVVNGKIIHEPVTKYIPANPTSAIFWLKNRRGWRDQQDVNHSGQVAVETIKRVIVDPGTGNTNT